MTEALICTIDYPKFIVSNQKEESISIQRVKFNHIFLIIRPEFFLLVDLQTNPPTVIFRKLEKNNLISKIIFFFILSPISKYCLFHLKNNKVIVLSRFLGK